MRATTRLGLACLLLVVTACAHSNTQDTPRFHVSHAGVDPVVIGGSTLCSNLLSTLFEAYTFAWHQIKVKSDPSGSQAGLEGVVSGKYAAAVVESYPTPDMITAGGNDLAVIPMLLVPIVPYINLPGLPSEAVILSRRVLAEIFLARVDRWNHPDIVALNPGVQLPDHKIITVVRSPGSGTAHVFSQALSTFNNDFALNIQVSTHPNWPGNPIQAKGTEDMVNTVKATPYSIGFGPYEPVLTQGVHCVQMITKTGQTVQASRKSLGQATSSSVYRFDTESAWSAGQGLPNALVDTSPSRGAWPIVAISALVVRRQQTVGCVELASVIDFVQWLYLNAKAEEIVKKAGFARLPSTGRSKIFGLLHRFTCGGEPVALNYYLFGSGGQMTADVTNEWATSYAFRSPHTLVRYAGRNSFRGLDDVITGESDFAFTQIPLTQRHIDYVYQGLLQDHWDNEKYISDLTQGLELSAYINIPVHATAVVPVYNLPGFSGVGTIVLPGDVLSLIFLGLVSNWRDAAILQHNSAIAESIPDLNITLVVRKGACGLSTAFVHALTHFNSLAEPLQDPEGYPPGEPQFNLRGGITTVVKKWSNDGVRRTIETTPGAVGILGLSDTLDRENPPSIAAMLNPAGDVVLPSIKSTLIAVETYFAGALKPWTIHADPVVMNHPEAWPMSIFTYLVYPKRLVDDCVSAKNLHDFLLWTQMDDTPRTVANALGHSPLPQKETALALYSSATVKCHSKPLDLTNGCPVGRGDVICSGFPCDMREDGNWNPRCYCGPDWTGTSCTIRHKVDDATLWGGSIAGAVVGILFLLGISYGIRRLWLYHHPPWLLKSKDVKPEGELGAGAFGVVYGGRYMGQRVAIKKIPLSRKAREALAQRLRLSTSSSAVATPTLHSVPISIDSTGEGDIYTGDQSHYHQHPSAQEDSPPLKRPFPVEASLAANSAEHGGASTRGPTSSADSEGDKDVVKLDEVEIEEGGEEGETNPDISGGDSEDVYVRTSVLKAKISPMQRSSLLLTSQHVVCLTADGAHQGMDPQPKKPQRSLKKLFRDEVSILAQLKNPYITFLYGAYTDEDYGYIVSEFMSRGSLFDLLHSPIKLGEQRRIRMARDAARGMLHLHKQKEPVIHGDLKSLNILVNENWSTKVADFGLAGTKGQKGHGSLLWMAPELLQGGKTTVKSDVYAFGIFLIELMTRRIPYDGIDLSTIVQNIETGILPEYEDSFHRGVRDLARACCHMNPNRRPDFEEIEERLHIMQTRATNEDEHQTAGVDHSHLISHILTTREMETYALTGNFCPRPYPSLTFLFFNLVGFRRMSATLGSSLMRKYLDTLFKKFKSLVNRYPHLDILETVDDCYIVVGGLNRLVDPPDVAVGMSLLAIQMHNAVQATPIDPKLSSHAPITLVGPDEGQEMVRLNHALGRVGIDSSSAMPFLKSEGNAYNQLAFDGDGVKTAALMEQTCPAGFTQVTETVRALIQHMTCFVVNRRGVVGIRGQGQVTTYFVDGAASERSAPAAPSKSMSFLPRGSVLKSASDISMTDIFHSEGPSRRLPTWGAMRLTHSDHVVVQRTHNRGRDPRYTSTGQTRQSRQSPRPFNPRLHSDSTSYADSPSHIRRSMSMGQGLRDPPFARSPSAPTAPSAPSARSSAPTAPSAPSARSATSTAVSDHPPTGQVWRLGSMPGLGSDNSTPSPRARPQRAQEPSTSSLAHSAVPGHHRVTSLPLDQAPIA